MSLKTPIKPQCTSKKMNDRELLELAAKAYLDKSWHGNEAYMRGFMATWNPLVDDGDALRLAVQLRLEVQVFEDVVSVNWPLNSISTRCVPDQLAATRRAIVRAAAEIGKAMK